MPLINGSSKKAIGQNVATEENAGKEPKQAIAIAFAKAREARKARGESVADLEPKKKWDSTNSPGAAYMKHYD